MPTAQVNGQSLYYEDTGGDGPAVIFSHGLFMDHEMFAPQVEALRDRYRCITWDERGHGGTARDTLEPFSYYDSADDLVARLRHLGVERAVLAGMSQGGFLSLRCALTHPEIVRALVLIDTQAGTEHPERLGGYMQLAQTWADEGLSNDTADFIAVTILGADYSGAEPWKARWRRMAPANILGCMKTLASRDDVSGRLGEIEIPALVIHGDADSAIELELAKALAHGLKQADLVVIKGAGHAANLTHAEEVNPAIECFLSGLS